MRLVGTVAVAVALACAIGRVGRAIQHNERYRFTTWCWGARLAAMALLGLLVKALT